MRYFLGGFFVNVEIQGMLKNLGYGCFNFNRYNQKIVTEYTITSNLLKSSDMCYSSILSFFQMALEFNFNKILEYE